MIPSFLQAAPVVKADDTLAVVLLDIAIILVAARLCGFAAGKLGQPRVVGEIVAGVLLGPTLLGPELMAWSNPPDILRCETFIANAADRSVSSCLFPPQSRAVLRVFGLVALTLFMFLVGLELDTKLLKGRYASIALVTVAVVAVPVALGFAIAPALHNADFAQGFGTDKQPKELAFTLFVGAMLSVTAFPVMVRILQEKGLQNSALGALGIASAAAVTVLMFLVTMTASGVAADRSTGSLLQRFGWVAVYIAVMLLIVRPLFARLFEGRYRARGFSLDLFVAALVVLFISAWVATRLEVNVIVGGFLAGIAMPAKDLLFRDLAARLSDLTASVLLPIFLAFSGLLTDFTKLRMDHVPGLALFIIAGIAAKWLAGAAAGRAGGLSGRDANALGVLMNCRGLLVLVVALVAFQEAKVITAPLQVGGVLMALITTAMTGPLFDRITRGGATQEVPAANGT